MCIRDSQYSGRLELQADCYAGVWAHHADGANRILEAGDVEEAMTAAAAIGDDALQRQAQGYAVPDSFTHGTSQQRVRWFNPVSYTHLDVYKRQLLDIVLSISLDKILIVTSFINSLSNEESFEVTVTDDSGLSHE